MTTEPWYFQDHPEMVALLARHLIARDELAERQSHERFELQKDLRERARTSNV